MDQFNLAPIDPIPFCDIFHCAEDLSPLEVAQKIHRGELQQARNKTSQGFSENYFWIQFSLEGNKQVQEWMLEIDNPHIDEIALYQKNDDWTKIGFGGDRGRLFEERSYLNRRFVFPIQSHDGPREFLLMIDKRNASVSFPLRLWDNKSYLDHEAKLNLIYGIYFGVLFFVSLISMLLAL